MSAQAARFSSVVPLAIGELMTGTFYLLMATIGLTVGGLTALTSSAFPAQAIVAAIVAVFNIVGLRRIRYRRMTREDVARNRNVNLDTGETLRIDAWSPGRCARMQYRNVARDVELAPNVPATVDELRIVEVRDNVLVVTSK